MLAYPVIFVSSAYVRVNTLPGWTQPVAGHQPVTIMCNAVRSLALGGPALAGLGHTTTYWALLSLAWAAGITLVFATLDALLSLSEIGGPVGYEGGVIAIGIRLAVVEPRISAAKLFAGSFVPATLFDEARQVTIPLQILLQWDDEGNDRQSALDLFDALGSKEKTLHANLGGHTGVPSFEIDAGARFFARHLK